MLQVFRRCDLFLVRRGSEHRAMSSWRSCSFSPFDWADGLQNRNSYVDSERLSVLVIDFSENGDESLLGIVG